MKKAHLLSHCTYKELLERDIELAILPWGACEAHNYHLPYGTDIIEAEKIADDAGAKAYSQGAAIIVLPAIPFGVNTGQTDILLDINLYPSTQYAILNDIIEVLDRQGIHKLLVLNSHGGNDFKSILRELGVQYPDMFLSSCDWFKSLDKTAYFENGGDHADEMETSLIMYYHPELVDLAAAGSGNAKKVKILGIREGWAWAERRWSQVTEDTGVGNPSKSTIQKGARYHNDVTDKLSQLFMDIADLDIEDMYE